MSRRIVFSGKSGKWARSLMICANSLANAKFLDDNRQTCDHLVDASMRTIKYRNVPQGGCIGPHISPCILSRKFNVSLLTFPGDGLIINFPCEHGIHVMLIGIVILFFKEWPVELEIILRIMDLPGWPSLSCHCLKASLNSLGIEVLASLDFILAQ